MTKIALDVMGGDYAPDEMIQGALDAVDKNGGVSVTLLGDAQTVGAKLAGLKPGWENGGRLSLVDAPEVILTEEPPVAAIRSKKRSSIVMGMQMVKSGEADAFVSAGSSGAVLVGALSIVGRLKGVERPPLAPLIPTDRGVTLLVDCGANVDARASHLVQFAQMGSIYMENVVGVKNPRVAIVNVGAEEEKGNALVKETFPLLKACPGINFIGSIEAREIPHGGADVVVCEAFAGNIILKLYEGVGSTILSTLKSALTRDLRTKIGALLIKPALKDAMKVFDASQYGGAPLLGLNGLVVKSHGNSKRREICNSILQCVTFCEQGVNEKFKAGLLGGDGAGDSGLTQGQGAAGQTPAADSR
ncbi:MAG: phosphate acyltransferase PlsX [Lachnospiraceae bacterium]|jgi:glycerol-3-phosphate acyltransferase PlsX|nr:phosphate acyltransferase PlsX [Lachnospiraceae bacterium]